MSNQYQNELNQIEFTEESKTLLIDFLTGQQHTSHVRSSKKWQRLALAAVAAICILTVPVIAATVAAPVLSNFFQNSMGYQQSSVALGESITKNGWTMTLTDSVMDSHNIYLGVELTAPNGTVLDWENGYYFAEWGCRIPDSDIAGSGDYTLAVDDDPSDNSLHFILFNRYITEDGHTLDGKHLQLTLGGLYHNVEWNEQERSFTRVYDCEETWDFSVAVSMPEKNISIQPNVPVTTLGVEATITNIDISPIGVYVDIEGDALKGHHSWVPRNAPDGWYGCVEYQEITLYLTDGTSISMNDGLEGSGCSGGTDTTEAGALHLARRTNSLIDMDTLDYISICGVKIPLS